LSQQRQLILIVLKEDTDFPGRDDKGNMTGEVIMLQRVHALMLDAPEDPKNGKTGYSPVPISCRHNSELLKQVTHVPGIYAMETTVRAVGRKMSVVAAAFELVQAVDFTQVKRSA
jgi:hypothetical protein